MSGAGGGATSTDRLENDRDSCYLQRMAKSLKTSHDGYVVKDSSATKVVRDPKTGQFVTVWGFGALKGSGLKIKKGIDLTKPIAEQALSPRPAKRKAG